MPSKQKELIFPLRGVDENWAFGRQPEGTTPDALNVVPFDTLDSRARGGQRWGLSKYYTGRHNGANAIQALDSIVISVTPGSADTDTFTQGNGLLDDTDWYPCLITYPNIDVSATYPIISGNKIVSDNTTIPASSKRVAALHKSNVLTSLTYSMSADISWVLGGAGSYVYAEFITRAKTPGLPYSIINLQVYGIRAWNDDDTVKVQINFNGISPGWVEATPGSGDWKDPTWWGAAERTLKIEVSGTNVVKMYVNNVLIGTRTVGSLVEANTYIGFALYKSSDVANSVTLDNFVFNPITSASNRDYKIISVSDGDVYTGSPAGKLALATNGENVVATTGRIGMQSAYGKIYFCDGLNANYRVWTASNNTVTAWTPDDGTLPTSGTDGCRYIALYRGRIVLSGLVSDPHNWFMTEAGDPLDIDYGGTPSAILPVAGNNTNAGLCPDIVTCLAPYTDDLLFIGGDHTLWLMRGDPASGGRLDNISFQTGISGPDAFTFDPNGIIYWYGSGGLWRMSADGVPESLSKNRMDKTFSAIDLTTNTVQLAWDNVRHGLHIFIVPNTERATTHYFWDQRTDSFWPIGYPNAKGPTRTFAFDGDQPDDNALLLGGWDGYIRQIDPSTLNDDGTAISSHIVYPPVSEGGSTKNTLINSLTAVLDTNSDDVVLTTYAEDTIQKTIEATTIRYARTLSAGRTRILNRVAGNAIKIVLSNKIDLKTWAIESLVVNVAVTGRTGKNQI